LILLLLMRLLLLGAVSNDARAAGVRQHGQGTA